LEPLAQRYIYCVRFINWVVHAPSDQTRQVCERAKQEYYEVAVLFSAWSKLSIAELYGYAQLLSRYKRLNPEWFIEAIDPRNFINVGEADDTQVDVDLTGSRKRPQLRAVRTQR
jgi:hypothetical protein